MMTEGLMPELPDPSLAVSITEQAPPLLKRFHSWPFSKHVTLGAEAFSLSGT